ncbi:beta-N-acetylhexosaminidase [Ectothiorhodospiraceae bacterium BW-2]|nr:beta-N-acetylhexosaminidase [Ectothiorhodospiraceae bacterium BW-2]
MSLGVVMIDLQGESITAEERQRLLHPHVGGVILFSRNFGSVAQLQALVSELHQLRRPPLLVAVDHEGGRVQRFREGFTALPAAGAIGAIFAHDRPRARELAEASGWVMAAELRSCGIDFSFTPVLDIDYGCSRVIGDRAFHSTAEGVSDLALHYMHGIKQAGMAAIGKHFPGHGGVEADSHHALPIDSRDWETILYHDLRPFKRLIDNGLDGVMPAHVLYVAIDSQPAGFSRFWLQQVLRQQFAFSGAIFSDDLSMEGAREAGSMIERAQLALKAGCDMVLVCNRPHEVESLLQQLPPQLDPLQQAHRVRLHGRGRFTLKQLHYHQRWQRAVESLQGLI